MLYLIKNVTTGTIKIGISKNPTKRLKQLQTSNAHKLQLIKVYDIEEDRHWEKRLHKMFWQNRLQGEWFRLVPLKDYLSLIDSLINEEKPNNPCHNKNNLVMLSAIDKIKIIVNDFSDTGTTEISFQDWINWGIDRKIQITKDSPAVCQIVKACKKKAIANALGRKPRKDSIKFLSWLVSLFGYELVVKRVRVGDDLEYRYSIQEACQFPKISPRYSGSDCAHKPQLP